MNTPSHDLRRDPSNELEFILRMLGIFYEMSNFGPREEISIELERVKISSDNPVGYFTDMLLAHEDEYNRPGSEDYMGHVVLIGVIYASLAHCVEAMRDNCSRDEQWYHVGWAHMYLGYLRGTVPGHQMGVRSESRRRAKKAASGRHKENHAMKQDAFDFLRTNTGAFKSMNAAADAVREIVPITFRTARDWVAEWHKSQKNQ